MKQLADLRGRKVFLVQDWQDATRVAAQGLRRQAVYVDSETCTLEKYRAEWAASLRSRTKPQYSPGLDPYKSQLRLTQLGFGDAVYLIDHFAVGWRIPALRDLLEAQRPVKWGVNLKFEYKHQLVSLDSVLDGIRDLMIAAKLLGVPGGSSLRALWGHYFPMEDVLDKSEQVSDWSGPLSDSQLRYAAMDIVAPMELTPRVVADLQRGGHLRAFAIENDAVGATAEIELNGMLLDTARHAEVMQQNRERAATLREEIWDALRPTDSQMALFDGARGVNLNSPAALKASLRSLGLDIDATNKEELILKAVHHPVVPKILEYKKATKLGQAFGAALRNAVHPVTGRIHPSVNQVAADTYRYSCSHPNLQQQPRAKWFRRIYVAGEGMRLVIADYTAIELVVGAVLTQDPKLLEIFRRRLSLSRRTRAGETVSDLDVRLADPHYVNAALMSGKDIMSCDSADRQNAKPGGYMFLYAGSADKYRRLALVDFGVTKTDAQAVSERAAWFDVYQNVGAWHKATQAWCRRSDGLLHTLAGYHLRPEWDPEFKSYSLPQVLNWGIQNPAAAGNKVALRLLWEYCRPWMRLAMRWKGPMLTATAHDEAHLSTPEPKAADAAREMETRMTAGMNQILGCDDLVLVEAHAGQDWSDK